MPANKPRHKQQHAANHMTQHNGCQPLSKSQRRQICACQYLGYGYSCPKPIRLLADTEVPFSFMLIFSLMLIPP